MKYTNKQYKVNIKSSANLSSVLVLDTSLGIKVVTIVDISTIVARRSLPYFPL